METVHQKLVKLLTPHKDCINETKCNECSWLGYDNCRAEKLAYRLAANGITIPDEAEWIWKREVGLETIYTLHCSRCDAESPKKDGWYQMSKHCPECGARMHYHGDNH